MAEQNQQHETSEGLICVVTAQTSALEEPFDSSRATIQDVLGQFTDVERHSFVPFKASPERNNARPSY